MRMITMRCFYVGLMAIMVGASSVLAARKTAVLVPLTEKGKQLEAKYTKQLKELKVEIDKALPDIDGTKKAEFLKLYQVESVAMTAELKTLIGQDRKPADHPSKAAYAEAQKTLEVAAKNALKPTAVMLADLQKFLESDKLDPQLAKCAVLTHAIPRGLAEYAQQGRKQEKLIDKLLADTDLMKQMVIGGGAKDGKYAQAMKIYTDIQKAGMKTKDGIFQRLALGVSLAHAVPIKQRSATGLTNAPATVDPVARYLSYEKAYLDGELDSGFKGLSVWDYRMVVNGEEPDETAAWGRKMLRNYRPDHISTSDTRWRYVKAVKTEVRYGSQYNKLDKPELQFFQNIIMNGGVCGRRAFFGRFILRAFGIPTTARPQRGHATLVHWSPDGWVINLGAGWTWGWMKNGQKDRDFLAETQARMTGEPFEQVQRAQWIGTALGEEKTLGFYADPSGFWNGVALYRQRKINEDSKAVALAAVGTDIGEANESKEKDVIEEVVLTDVDKAVVVAKDGTITIPAVSCNIISSNPPGKILFMESNLGGKQLHYSRNGKPVDFEYTFEAPKAGKYALSARVVTVTGDQHLLVTANGAKSVDITLPLTLGMWDKTEPVEVKLLKGKNVLKFSRGSENIRGLTIRDFTLKTL